MTVRRPEKYGGNKTYECYEDLAVALESGELHPADAKETVAGYLDELISPGREKLRELSSE